MRHRHRPAHQLWPGAQAHRHEEGVHVDVHIDRLRGGGGGGGANEVLEMELTARETSVMFLTQFPNKRLSTERENSSWLLWGNELHHDY